jgi:AraC-like DNA-binding protein
MSNSAVLTTEAREQSRQSGVALAATLMELLTVAQSKVEFDRQAAQACLSRATALLAASLERDGGPKAESAFRGRLPRWQAKRVVTYIEENLDQPIRSPDLIALTGISAGHFFRIFKATFGQTPFAYIASRRVEHAQQMMLTTSDPLCQIALDCGLCDQSHLTRLFRRHVGTTPSEWRREYACGSFESTPADAHVVPRDIGPWNRSVPGRVAPSRGVTAGLDVRSASLTVLRCDDRVIQN